MLEFYLPIPPKQKMKFIIIALLLIPFAAGTSSAEQESSKLSSDGMHRLRALVVDQGSMPADFYSLSVNGDRVEGISAASKTSVQSMRSAKSSKKSHSGVCNKRLIEAYEQIKDRVPNINEPEDVTKLCSFITPTSGRENFGCPFAFFPADYGVNFFPKGVKEYEGIFGELFEPPCAEGVAESEGAALASVALYCSCHQAYDLGCSNELPTTPQEKDEYCEFAGVWNGDFNSTDVELSPKTIDCGCFWISEVTKEVGNCPGVDLGYFFPLPPLDSIEECPFGDQASPSFFNV
jgi:hypothetical protein